MRNYGIGCQVVTVLQDANLDVDILEDFRQYVSDDLKVPHIIVPIMGMKRPIPFTQRYQSIAPKYCNQHRRDRDWIEDEWVITRCHAGETGVYIDPAGEVHACYTMREVAGSDKYFMGSLREQSFRDLVDSKRSWHVRGLVEMCSGCYNGCEIFREEGE